MSLNRQTINLKSADQVDKMQASADILASVFLEVRKLVEPGVTTGALACILST